MKIKKPIYQGLSADSIETDELAVQVAKGKKEPEVEKQTMDFEDSGLTPYIRSLLTDQVKYGVELDVPTFASAHSLRPWVVEKFISTITSESAASGKDMDKLVGFLKRALDGKVKQEGMIAAGFDLSSPAKNNESKLTRELATRLSLKITEDDLRTALEEVGVKSASDVVQRWLKRTGTGVEAPVKGKQVSSKFKSSEILFWDDEKEMYYIEKDGHQTPLMSFEKAVEAVKSRGIKDPRGFVNSVWMEDGMPGSGHRSLSSKFKSSSVTITKKGDKYEVRHPDDTLVGTRDDVIGWLEEWGLMAYETMDAVDEKGSVTESLSSTTSESDDIPDSETGEEEDRAILVEVKDDEEDPTQAMLVYEDDPKSLYIEDYEVGEKRYYGEWDGDEDPTAEDLAEELENADPDYVESLFAEPEAGPEGAAKEDNPFAEESPETSESRKDEPESVPVPPEDENSEEYGDSDDLLDAILASNFESEADVEININAEKVEVETDENESADEPVMEPITGQIPAIEVDPTIPGEEEYQEDDDWADLIVNDTPEVANVGVNAPIDDLDVDEIGDIIEDVFGQDVGNAPMQVLVGGMKATASKTVQALPRIRPSKKPVQSKVQSDDFGFISDLFKD